MNQYKDGEVLYHKATRDRCVVIRKNNDGTYRVRDQHDKEHDYYPHELEEPKSQIVNRKPFKRRYLY